MNTNYHHGQIVELTIRKRGISITDLAFNLGVNRRTIYNWFDTPYLKHNIIHRIGLSIDHDFSVEFPAYFKSTKPNNSSTGIANSLSTLIPQSTDWKGKYIDLLERYNQILSSMYTL